MAELVARGPIACTIAVTEEFEQYSSGVFNDTTGALVTHDECNYQVYEINHVQLIYT